MSCYFTEHIHPGISQGLRTRLHRLTFPPRIESESSSEQSEGSDAEVGDESESGLRREQLGKQARQREQASHLNKEQGDGSGAMHMRLHW